MQTAMGMTQFIIILLVLVVGFTMNFYKAYFSELGKNSATKKDIQEITNQVEAVKIGFTKEIEHLRGDLLFKNTIKGIMYTDKKEAVTKLYEAIHLWYETIDNHLISAIEYNQEKLDAAEQEIEKYEFNISIAESKAELYIHDDSFFELLDTYWKKITELEKLTMSLLIEYGHILNWEFPSEKAQYETKKKAHDNSFEKSKPIRNEINITWLDFRDECFKKLSEL